MYVNSLWELFKRSMALHGGLSVFTVVHSLCSRLRQAAIAILPSALPGDHVFTPHDSIAVGEEGPYHEQ